MNGYLQDTNVVSELTRMLLTHKSSAFCLNGRMYGCLLS